MNKIDLNGRCAVVTGGAQGFGRAITERFVASGAKVAIWDHDQPFAEKTAREIGAGVTAFKVDVSDLATLAPDATKRSVIARPKPCAPPVTTAQRPFRSILFMVRSEEHTSELQSQ